jgi:hypothetical protein
MPKKCLWLTMFLGLSASLRADIVVSWSDSGWYNSTGFHVDINNNYIVGFQGEYAQGVTPITYNDFFVFDLSNVTGPITSAVLSLHNPGCPPCGYQSMSPTETYTLFDVSTPISTLEANHTGVGSPLAPEIFNDLGSGTIFGSRTVSAADNGTLVHIALNSDAVAAIDAHLGGMIAVGGSLTSLFDSLPPEDMFASGGNNPGDTRLLTLNPTPVPEPSAAILFSAVLLGLGARAFWRRGGGSVR